MDEDFVAFSKTEEEKDVEDGGEGAAPALLTSTPAPWLAYSFQYDKKAPPFVRLHNEILTLCEYIAPSVHEMNQREIVLHEVTEIIHSLWPTSTVSVFGSQMTKILTPTSDLDIVVMGVTESRHDPLEIYCTLAEKLKDSSLVSYVEAITNAKVPIVKFDHRKSGISVDICINNDSGMRTGALIRKFVREYPPLRPLVLVLKMFLVSLNQHTRFFFGYCSVMVRDYAISSLYSGPTKDERDLLRRYWFLRAHAHDRQLLANEAAKLRHGGHEPADQRRSFGNRRVLGQQGGGVIVAAGAVVESGHLVAGVLPIVRHVVQLLQRRDQHNGWWELFGQAQEVQGY